MALQGLTELSELTRLSISTDEALDRAQHLLRQNLQANDVFVVHGEGETFRCFGTCHDLGLSDVALWLIHRELTSERAPQTFDVSGEHVQNFRPCEMTGPCTHVAALLPVATSTGEMIITRGDWPDGFGSERAALLQAALPAMALLVQRRIDSLHGERLRYQLSALANITRVMSDSQDVETVLTGIAGTVATVTGFDYVSIDLLDVDGQVMLRCTNSMREQAQALGSRWKRGANRPDPVRDSVVATGKPMVFTDVQNDERIPESGRNFFIRTLIRSTAVFPLLTKDAVTGTLSVASYLPRQFTPQEVEMLEGLASQAATAVQGIQLYRELRESREELQRLNQELHDRMGIEHHLARTDPLTGIPNRRFIDETVNAEVSRARRYGHPLSVIVADVDNLKEINDRYSHQAGDESLRFVAEVARESCRDVDVVGRYGGDEFVFVLPSTAVDDAVFLAERFRTQLSERPTAARTGHPLRMTVSLGTTEWDGGSMREPLAVVRQADRALYQAKASGRNRTVALYRDGARVA